MKETFSSFESDFYKSKDSNDNGTENNKYDTLVQELFLLENSNLVTFIREELLKILKLEKNMELKLLKGNVMANFAFAMYDNDESCLEKYTDYLLKLFKSYLKNEKLVAFSLYSNLLKARFKNDVNPASKIRNEFQKAIYYSKENVIQEIKFDSRINTVFYTSEFGKFLSFIFLSLINSIILYKLKPSSKIVYVYSDF